MELQQVYQRFYVEENCVEHVMSFEQLCALINVLSSNLKDAAIQKKDIAILFCLSPLPEESVIQDELVLTKRTSCVIEIRLVPKGSNKLQRLDFDDFETVQRYFNI